ncbi:uncharacterized protein LOC129597253 [Paramacrobiotus metropolitanus]|uniref:uncharacterized protein LOC129597253 n=1 Tax=Paramacrobiotus metropolitanus TaxID=2943436 RepID=UPI002445624F|nr:uncharacterized protein LOC129597253 [Paramacrobiotus metropolitanus]
MEKPSKRLGNPNIMLAFAIVEILLTGLGFAANLYSLFYGALAPANHFPILQILAFVLSIPVYLGQLAAGMCFMEAGVQVYRGHRDPTSIADREMFTACSQICGVYLGAMVFAWFCAIAFDSDWYISKLGVWGAIHHVVDADQTGQFVMLGSLLTLIASMVVVCLAASHYGPVDNDPKAASTNEKQGLLDHADGRNMPPPSYESVEMKITV